MDESLIVPRLCLSLVPSVRLSCVYGVRSCGNTKGMVSCFLQLINSVNLTGGKSSQCIFKVKIIWTKINPFPNVLGWGVLEGNCGDSGHQNKDPLNELFSGSGQLFQRKVSLHRKSLSMWTVLWLTEKYLVDNSPILEVSDMFIQPCWCFWYWHKYLYHRYCSDDTMLFSCTFHSWTI